MNDFVGLAKRIIINQKLLTMKKYFKFSALLLSVTILLSSCIGSFKLTNNIKDWNEGVSSKWVNEAIFIALHVVPVYPIAMFVDGVVLNSVEFWTGSNLVMEQGETKIVKNSEGQDVEITALENGYRLSDGQTSMNLVFDNETRVWSAEYNNQTTQLVKLVDENNAQLFLAGGEMMDINANNVDMACFALNK